MNCWEFLKCGVEETCPAHPSFGLDCWKVTGTKCDGGKVEKLDKAEKINHCQTCDFYKQHANKF
ncbi:MAG: hypothetical protein KAS32_13575 [Candidatus Peribacteraceae bacterium]|nr:hypothetical protein [Candidatus Peribacteraceae bacterium]